MTQTPDRSMLGKVELFQGLADGVLGEILSSATRRRFAKGIAVFEQGQPGKACHVLLEGRLKVSQITLDGQQVVVHFIGPGEMFGCVPTVIGGDYPATATAVTEIESLAWEGKVMNALMDRHPRIALNALATVGRRFHALQARYRELATERVERRIARAILRLARQAGRRVEDGVLIDFPLSRQDIAEMTGATLHTVSRILSAWEQQGLVESGRQRITIRRPHGLVSIAEDL